MTEQEAKTEARKRDLRAKSGLFYRAECRKGNWVVIEFDCETEKKRVVAR